MENLVKFSVNIAMESTIVLMLGILLATLFWQKKLFPTTVPLIVLTGFIIALLLEQIATWVMLIQHVPLHYGATPMRVVYVLDYLFYYGVSCAFYFYVEALAVEGYKRIGSCYRPNRNLHIILIAWGAVMMLDGIVLAFEPTLYRVENGVPIFSIPGYVCINILNKFACACALGLVIRHRKAIGRNEASLSIGFLLFVSLFSVVDDLCGLCISYVLSSLLVFALYVRINLHKGLLLERQEREILEWKTQIMLSQMQPHFLYNVLTTISSLCEMQNATEARDVVNRFADYFRQNLDSLGTEKTVPFEKELEHIRTYLWLEKIRFEDALCIRYEIGPTDFSVPSLAIQPVVENAVKHGILPKEEPGTVTIRTGETPQEYFVVVEDDGVGFESDAPKNDGRYHVGIENVRNRLELVCNGSCDIQSETGKGTVVTIHIPKGDWQ